MRVQRLDYDIETIHLPCVDDKYPYELIDPPYPLCGLTGIDAMYGWTYQGANCEICRRVENYYQSQSQGQMTFRI